MRLIICGGRYFDDHELFRTAVTRWIEAHGWPSEVITGGAKGADAMGKAWALENGVPHREFIAQWGQWGKRAGPKRNGEQARYASPDGGCLALPGGDGTADMIRQAHEAGLAVMDVEARCQP